MLETNTKLIISKRENLRLTYKPDDCSGEPKLYNRCFDSPRGVLPTRVVPLRSGYAVGYWNDSSWIPSCIRPEVDGGYLDPKIKPDSKRAPTLISCAISLKGILMNHTKIFEHVGYAKDEIYVSSDIFPSGPKPIIEKLDLARLSTLGKHGESKCTNVPAELTLHPFGLLYVMSVFSDGAHSTDSM